MGLDNGDLKKTKRLELLLLEEIQKLGSVPHREFLSEREIRDRYGYNQTAVRRAVNHLAQTGVLYRINGKGTFIAPKKQRMVLFVSRYSVRQYGVEHNAVFDLFAGALAACEDQPSFGLTCAIVTGEELLRNLADCDRVYLNLSAVVFMSDPITCRTCQPVLQKKKIPFFYYGNDHKVVDGEFPYTFLYSQAGIVDLALSYLIGKGRQKIGLLTSNSVVRLERFEISRQWLFRCGLGPDQDKIFQIDYNYQTPRQERFAIFARHLREHPVPADTDALFCMDDSLALCFLQGMYRNQQPVEGRLAVMGVNNYPLCEEVFPPLTTVEIPFFADGITLMERIFKILDGDDTPFKLYAKIRVVPRNSA